MHSDWGRWGLKRRQGLRRRQRSKRTRQVRQILRRKICKVGDEETMERVKAM